MKSAGNASGILIKTTLVDFPGRVSCAFFLRGCNLRCPYCYNTGLVLGGTEASNDNFVSQEELFLHLEKRRSVLSGLVISGGEPLLTPSLPEIIEKAKSLGYKVKLDTNGCYPDKLKALFSKPETKPDYIAMDLKTSFSKYFSYLGKNSSIIFENALAASIKLISDFPTEQREFRTVLVPDLLTEEDIDFLSKQIPEDSRWFFANFQNQHCLDQSYDEKKPYSQEEIEKLIKKAQLRIKAAVLR